MKRTRPSVPRSSATSEPLPNTQSTAVVVRSVLLKYNAADTGIWKLPYLGFYDSAIRVMGLDLDGLARSVDGADSLRSISRALELVYLEASVSSAVTSEVHLHSDQLYEQLCGEIIHKIIVGGVFSDAYYIARLSGGLSGALVFQVELEARAGLGTSHGVIKACPKKLDRDREVRGQKQASASWLADAGWVDRMPMLEFDVEVSPAFSTKNYYVTLQPLAFPPSLETATPPTLYSSVRAGRIAQVRKCASRLGQKYGETYIQAKRHGTDIAGYPNQILDSLQRDVVRESRTESFWLGACLPLPSKFPHVYVCGRRVVNPLSYLINGTGKLKRRVVVRRMFQHADLNARNIILSSGGNGATFKFIDFEKALECSGTVDLFWIALSVLEAATADTLVSQYQWVDLAPRFFNAFATESRIRIGSGQRHLGHVEIALEFAATLFKHMRKMKRKPEEAASIELDMLAACAACGLLRMMYGARSYGRKANPGGSVAERGRPDAFLLTIMRIVALALSAIGCEEVGLAESSVATFDADASYG